MFEIEKNVELPPDRRSGDQREELYPFAKMAIGDSFFVPFNRERKASVRSRVSGASSYFSKKYGLKFATRSFTGGIRVWRIASVDDNRAKATPAPSAKPLIADGSSNGSQQYVRQSWGQGQH